MELLRPVVSECEVKSGDGSEIFRESLNKIVVVDEQYVKIEIENLRRHRTGERIESEIEKREIRCF